MAGAGDSLRRLAQRAERMERQWPADAAAQVERVVTADLRSATGDGALSRLSGGRATVVVRRSAGGATVEAGGNRGLWAILERGTKPHTVTAKRGRLLRTPAGPRPRVQVSGVRARKTWSQGV